MVKESTFYKTEQPGPTIPELRNKLDELEALRAAIFEREMFEFHTELREAVVEKENGAPTRVIRGYASTKNVDRYGDIIEPSAYRRSLKSWVNNGVILLYHNTEKAMGLPLSGEIDERGLKIEATIGQGVQYVDDAWSLIQQRILKALSVGFRILPKGEKWMEEVDPGSGFKVRIIKKLELFETSVVSIPANRESLFEVAKGIETGSDLEGKRPEWYERRIAGGIVPDTDILRASLAQAELEERGYEELDQSLSHMDTMIKKLRDTERNATVNRAVNRLHKFVSKKGVTS